MATEVARSDSPGLTANWKWIVDAPGTGQALSGVGEPAQRLIPGRFLPFGKLPPGSARLVTQLMLCAPVPAKASSALVFYVSVAGALELHS